MSVKGSCQLCGAYGHYPRDCPEGDGTAHSMLPKPLLVRRTGTARNIMSTGIFTVPSVETDTPPSSVSSDTGPPSEDLHSCPPMHHDRAPGASQFQAQAHVRSWLETASASSHRTVRTNGTLPLPLPLTSTPVNTASVNTASVKLREELAEETCRLADAERTALRSTREELTTARRDLAIKEQEMKNEVHTLKKTHNSELSNMSNFYARKEAEAVAQQEEFKRQTTASVMNMISQQRDELRKDIVREQQELEDKEKKLSNMEENLMQRIAAAEEAEDAQRGAMQQKEELLAEREKTLAVNEEALRQSAEDIDQRTVTVEEHEKAYTQKLQVLNEQRNKLEEVSARLREGEQEHAERELTVTSKEAHVNDRMKRVQDKEEVLTETATKLETERAEIEALTDELRQLERRMHETNLNLEAREFSLAAKAEQLEVEVEEHKKSVNRQLEQLHDKKLHDEAHLKEAKQAVYDLRKAAQEEADQIREALRKQEMLNNTEQEQLAVSQQKASEIIEQSKRVETSLKAREDNAVSKETSAERAIKALEDDFRKLEEQRNDAVKLQEALLTERREIDKGCAELKRLDTAASEVQELRSKLTSECAHVNDQLVTQQHTLAQIEQASRVMLETQADLDLREEKHILKDAEIQEKLRCVREVELEVSMRQKELTEDSKHSLETMARAQAQLDEEQTLLKEREHDLAVREESCVATGNRARANEEEARTLEASLADLQAQLGAKVDKLQAQLGDKADELGRKEHDARIAATQAATLQGQLESKSREVARLEARAEDREESVARLEADIISLRSRLATQAEQQRNASTLQAEVNSRSSEVVALHEQLEAKESEIVRLETHLTAMRTELKSQAKTEIASLKGRLEVAEARCRDRDVLEDQVERANSEVSAVRAEMIRRDRLAHDEAAALEVDKTALMQRTEDLEGHLVELQVEIDKLRTLDTLRTMESGPSTVPLHRSRSPMSDSSDGKYKSRRGSEGSRWDITVSSDTVRQMGYVPVGDAVWLQEMEEHLRGEIEKCFEDGVGAMGERMYAQVKAASLMSPSPGSSFMLPPRVGSPGSRGSSPACGGYLSPGLRPFDAPFETYTALMDSLWTARKSLDMGAFQDAWEKLNSRVISDAENASRLGFEMSDELKQSKVVFEEQDELINKLKGEKEELTAALALVFSENRKYESTAMYTQEEIKCLVGDRDTLDTLIEDQRKNGMWLETELLETRCVVKQLEAEAEEVRWGEAKLGGKLTFISAVCRWWVLYTVTARYFHKLQQHTWKKRFQRMATVMRICRDAALRSLLPSIERHHLSHRFHAWELFVREKFIMTRQQRATMILNDIKGSLLHRSRLSTKRHSAATAFTASPDFVPF